MSEVETMIAATSNEWADRWIQARVAQLTKKKAVASGSLNNSLAQQVSQKDANPTVTIQVAFEDSGRYIDMKRYSHDQWGRNAIDRLADWITRRGIQNFERKFLEKYKLQKAPKDMLQRMAWGIMVNRSENKFRRKNWYAKSSAGAVTDLYNQVASKLPLTAAKEIKNGFKQ